MCEHAFGCSRRGFTFKVHCVADALGRLLGLHLTDSEAVLCQSYDALMASPFHTSGALFAANEYDSDAIRDDFVDRGVTLVIPG
jgi:hypothetical protein